MRGPPPPPRPDGAHESGRDGVVGSTVTVVSEEAFYIGQSAAWARVVAHGVPGGRVRRVAVSGAADVHVRWCGGSRTCTHLTQNSEIKQQVTQRQSVDVTVSTGAPPNTFAQKSTAAPHTVEDADADTPSPSATRTPPRPRSGPPTVAIVLYGVRFNGLLNQNVRVLEECC